MIKYDIYKMEHETGLHSRVGTVSIDQQQATRAVEEAPEQLSCLKDGDHIIAVQAAGQYIGGYFAASGTVRDRTPVLPPPLPVLGVDLD